MSYIRPTIHSIPYVSSGTKPMYEVCIDSVGPFPADKDNYKYIIVIIDNFTRYLTLHRSVDTSAKAAGEALFNHCCTYGVPKMIHTDNGAQYVNSLISTLTNLFNIKHNLSIAYSSQENGICERANKEVGRHLQMLTVGQGRTEHWSSFLPLVQRIINASVHSATGHSPSQLMFGDAVDHRQGLFPTTITDVPIPIINTDEWIQSLIEKQAAMLEIARTRQAEVNENSIAVRNENRGDRELTSYNARSYVLVKYPHSNYGRGPPTKLLPFWKGPMRVERRNGDRYTLRNLVTGKEGDYHVQLLKPFLYDERVTDPLEIAVQEHDEYLVDEILAHRFPARIDGRSPGLECQVSWLGYQEISWEPVSNLKRLAKFHAYARSNRLLRYIPRVFRDEGGPGVIGTAQGGDTTPQERPVLPAPSRIHLARPRRGGPSTV